MDSDFDLQMTFKSRFLILCVLQIKYNILVPIGCVNVVSKNYSDPYAVTDVGQMWNFAILGCPKMKKIVFGLCKNEEKNICYLNHFSGKNFLSKKIIQINMQWLMLAKCEISRY